jgi:hypothetical protein
LVIDYFTQPAFRPPILEEIAIANHQSSIINPSGTHVAAFGAAQAVRTDLEGM